MSARLVLHLHYCSGLRQYVFVSTAIGSIVVNPLCGSRIFFRPLSSLASGDDAEEELLLLFRFKMVEDACRMMESLVLRISLSSLQELGLGTVGTVETTTMEIKQ